MKKKSSSRIPTLKRKLWKVFSEFIRLRDKGICFTCGRKCEGKGYHAGHWIPDAAGGIALRFNELNVHGQCYHCNINLGGYGERYTQRMEEFYGEGTIHSLRSLKNVVIKDFPYEGLTKTYKQKIQDLQKMQSGEIHN